MNVHDTRAGVRAPAIPRPRDAEPEPHPEVEVTAPATPELPPARFPWPEPWRSAAGSRPRTEFWDVATAGWRSRGPQPRSGD